MRHTTVRCYSFILVIVQSDEAVAESPPISETLQAGARYTTHSDECLTNRG